MVMDLVIKNCALTGCALGDCVACFGVLFWDAVFVEERKFDLIFIEFFLLLSGELLSDLHSADGLGCVCRFELRQQSFRM